MARPFLSQVPDKDKSVKHLTGFGRGGGLKSIIIYHISFIQLYTSAVSILGKTYLNKQLCIPHTPYHVRKK